MSSFLVAEVSSPTIAGSEENQKYMNIPNSAGSLVDVSLSTPIPDGTSKTPIAMINSTAGKKMAEVSAGAGLQHCNPLMVSLDVSASSSEDFCLTTPMLSEAERSRVSPDIGNYHLHEGNTPVVQQDGSLNTTTVDSNQSLMRSLDGIETSIVAPEADDNGIQDYENEQEEEVQEDSIEETEDERVRREMEESERLCWQLMQEEQNAAYQAQMEFLSQNADVFSEEDRAALNMVMQESAAVIEQNSAERATEQGEGEEDGEEEDEEDEDEAWAGGQHYERLLELGRVLGDVKTEKWRMRSAGVIKDLPTTAYSEVLKEHSNSCVNGATSSLDTDSAKISASNVATASSSGEKKRRIVRTLDKNCSVCMEVFEPTSILCVLPCDHYFHVPCAEGWLTDNNSCPVCKLKITSSP